MRSHFLKRCIQFRFVRRSFDDRGLRVVRDYQLRRAAKVFKSSYVSFTPGFRIFRPKRSPEAKATSTQRCDEQMSVTDFAVRLIYYWNLCPGKIRERFFTGVMYLPHAQCVLRQPFSVVTAESRVLVAVRVFLFVFVPEQRQIYSPALQLIMNPDKIWLRADNDGTGRRWRKQQCLQ